MSILTAAAKAALVISSLSFSQNGMIPSRFSCEGNSISPALHLDKIPEGTKTLAVIVHDPDAPVKGGFTHWVAWNIDPQKDIPEDFKGGSQGHNGAGKTGYTGPCPPSGTHHYHFMVYALDARLDIDGNSGKVELEKAMKGHILAEGDLVGLYAKQQK
jgi:Raf kinase inhibitor-like YbhB/YbcL family protein